MDEQRIFHLVLSTLDKHRSYPRARYPPFVVVDLVMRKILRYKLLKSRNMTWLELTPPSHTSNTKRQTNCSM